MNKNKYKKLLLVDLDGVLNEYNGVFDKEVIPPIKCGAKELLMELSKNYDIKIFTTRNRLLVSKWLIKNNLDVYVLDVINVKEPAFLHIDDRCVNFEGNFSRTLEQIEKFAPHWKLV